RKRRFASGATAPARGSCGSRACERNRAPRERPQRAPGAPLVVQEISGNLHFTAEADCRRRSELMLTCKQTAALCLGLGFLPFAEPPLGGGEGVGAPNEELLRQVRVGTATASLFAYLRERSQDDDDLLQIDRLIRELGGKDFKQRERAVTKLTRLNLV